MSSNMSLPEFGDHVDRVRADMRARRVFTVYFQHDTLIPGNVRGTWQGLECNGLTVQEALRRSVQIPKT